LLYWQDILVKKYHNKNLTLEWLERFPDKDWDWKYGISANPNLTMEWISNFIYEKWNWRIINPDILYDKDYENKMRKYMAAYKIQQWWYKITLSPEYKR
jgi:hypothetical protein